MTKHHLSIVSPGLTCTPVALHSLKEIHFRLVMKGDIALSNAQQMADGFAYEKFSDPPLKRTFHPNGRCVAVHSAWAERKDKIIGKHTLKF